MKLLLTIIVTFFAGMGAGLGTGFAGMSAAAVISPMLITFLGMEPYMAVGIALSSDVLASAVSAYTYGKNKNLDVRRTGVTANSILSWRKSASSRILTTKMVSANRSLPGSLPPIRPTPPAIPTPAFVTAQASTRIS